MKNRIVQCPKCLPKEGIQIPELSLAEKRKILESIKVSPLQAILMLCEKYSLSHLEAKYMVLHIHTDYGFCVRCSFDQLEGEYVHCPKCKSLNLNWKL